MKSPTTTAKTSRRLGREDWVGAARKALVEWGIHDVKVDRLARLLRVSRGSFYWHFKRRSELLDALLTDWEARNYFEIAQVRARWARSAPDIATVIALWLSEDPNVLSFDMAVRAWARRAPEVAQSVRRIDRAWIELLQDYFERDGLPKDEAVVRARVSYFHQIGYWALDLEEEPGERLRLVPTYYEVLTGRKPSPELGRLLKEHAAAKPKRRAKNTVS
ncbi:TetR/AcrR family transcriptional regulator [Sphingosinicella soli]|uniref:AcrR family transcriptional regulator n=1 Tax=Sphingosinicella soli TaxID=333708 RepID=A0A7W7B4C6_9SPHN|nr:TetR/AcrR family transcriptional regulator [Sphingosinicella soli]MBB4633704.1 AcrR family transcriptional regulator [Sphingosinicella soli]